MNVVATLLVGAGLLAGFVLVLLVLMGAIYFLSLVMYPGFTARRTWAISGTCAAIAVLGLCYMFGWLVSR